MVFWLLSSPLKIAIRNVEEKISSASVTMRIVQLQSRTEYTWLMPIFVHLKSHKSLPAISVNSQRKQTVFCVIVPLFILCPVALQPFALQTAFP